MNFVVAALILARYHEISPLATCADWSDINIDVDYDIGAFEPPNYKAESDVFWLFQVSLFREENYFDLVHFVSISI